MIGTYVPDLITPYEPGPLAAGLRAACMALPAVGRDPGDEAITILMAQIALETGRGRACHRGNLGNLKATETYTGHYTCFRCNEIIKNKVEWFSPGTGGFTVPPGHPQTRFRAYVDENGEPAIAHATNEEIAFLAARKRYAKAWLQALAGDPVAYVHELKLAGYFTASEALYRKGVVALCDTYRPIVADSHKLEHADCAGAACNVDEDTVHSPMSHDDLLERLKDLEWEDDWRDAVDAERKAKELENDMETSNG